MVSLQVSLHTETPMLGLLSELLKEMKPETLVFHAFAISLAIFFFNENFFL